MTLEEAYAEYYGSSASPRPFLHSLTTIVDATAEADAGVLGADPRYHFGNERFSESQEVLAGRWRRAMAAGTAGNQAATRHLLGLSLAAIQDFYSHTNWVELGNPTFNRDVGITGKDFFNVAGPRENTCSDCPEGADGEGSCRDNLLQEMVGGGTLTSGYSGEAIVNGQKVGKPRGVDKCSHGGPRDGSRVEGARGGINKDLPTACFSPHHHLHQQAAEMAVEASEYYLNLVRGSLGDASFLRLLALPPTSPAIVLVVDTTDSMGSQLEALRHSLARLAEGYDSLTHPPSQYILVPFNDPLYGPAIVSDRPHQLQQTLNQLRATGGGDEAEPVLSALSLALHHAPPQARLYLFTDATIKDPELYEAVLTLALEKDIMITPFITRPPHLGGIRGRFDLSEDMEEEEEEGNVPAEEEEEKVDEWSWGMPDLHNNTAGWNGAPNRNLRDPRAQMDRNRRQVDRSKRQVDSLSQYTQMAWRTGGQLVEATRDNLEEVTRILETGHYPQAVLWREGDIVSERRLQFPVDSLVGELTVALTGRLNTATLTSPSDTTFDLLAQTTTTDDKGFTVQVFTPYYVQVLISLQERGASEYGEWTLRVVPSVPPVNVLVTATTSLDLLPTLYTPDHSASQPSLQRVQGQAGIGRDTYLDLVLTGVDTAGLRRVEEGRLLGSSGSSSSIGSGGGGGGSQDSSILSLPTVSPRRNTYIRLPSRTLPSHPFSVAVEGVDGRGHRFRRESSGSGWESGDAHVSFPLGRDIWGPPGAQLRVPVTVYSSASFTTPVTLFLSAHDALGIPVTLDKQRVTLGRNESVTVVATVSLDPQMSPSTQPTTTLTVTATPTQGRTARSLAYVSATPRITDLTPPTCEVVSKTSCANHQTPDTCSILRWTADLRFTDYETGIFSVNSVPKYDFPLFNTGQQVVRMSYLASCCDPKATITVRDAANNIAVCDIDNGGVAEVSKLSTGAIAGISVGVIVLVILLALLALILLRRHRRSRKESVTEVRRRRRMSVE
ncbi:hypothetical protein Pmani_034651 [Petrolisthes manimaculis]|uniref:VWFA domain-containing protein n=1 Tax=Petrolisthes manimaculis TaxID=1843537 RepID=A0AAE1TPG7_9EUCA|nr:hypothetical protein Pmani_034651 [Petrolisthes manimaculis]